MNQSWFDMEQESRYSDFFPFPHHPAENLQLQVSEKKAALQISTGIHTKNFTYYFVNQNKSSIFAVRLLSRKMVVFTVGKNILICAD